MTDLRLDGTDRSAHPAEDSVHAGMLVRCQFAMLNQDFFHSAVLRDLGLVGLGERIYAESVDGTRDVVRLLRLFLGRGCTFRLPSRVGRIGSMPSIGTSIGAVLEEECNIAAEFAETLGELAGRDVVAADAPLLAQLDAIRSRLQAYLVWLNEHASEIRRSGEATFLSRNRSHGGSGPLEQLFDVVFGSEKPPAGMRTHAGPEHDATFANLALSLLPYHLAVIEQTFAHAFFYYYWGLPWLADMTIAHSIQEMRDAMRLAQAAMDIAYSARKLEVEPAAAVDPAVCHDTSSALRADRELLATSCAAIAAHLVAFRVAGAGGIAGILESVAERHRRYAVLLDRIILGFDDAGANAGLVRDRLWDAIVADAGVKVTGGWFDGMLTRWS